MTCIPLWYFTKIFVKKRKFSKRVDLAYLFWVVVWHPLVLYSQIDDIYLQKQKEIIKNTLPNGNFVDSTVRHRPV